MPDSKNYSLLQHILFPPVVLGKLRLLQALHQKTILITGASYGIGECLAYALAAPDIHLILVARTAEKLSLIKQELKAGGCRVTIYPTDLSKPEQVDQLIEKLLQLPNGIDIVINNAGKSIRRSINDSLDRYHDFTRSMAINYFGPVKLLLALIPVLKGKQGHIINVSAINVLLAPAPLWSAYQSSKTAFDQWFRCVTPELNAAGVTTTSVYLPLVKTRMIVPTAHYDNMPAMSPEHVAHIICNCLIHKKKRYAPWWLIFGQLGSVIFGRLWASVNTHHLRRGQKQ